MNYLEQFDILHGFKFSYAEETKTEDKQNEITIFHFENEKHVAIDVIIRDDGGIDIQEPYAIDSEGIPVKGEFYIIPRKFDGIEKPKMEF